MVYDVSTVGQAKKERVKISGKLIGIQSDSSKCKIYDPDSGKFTWIRLSIVIGQENDKDVFLNVTCYDVDFSVMPELKKADALLKEGNRPEVEVEYYTSTKVAMDQDNKPIMEGDKAKVYLNHRMNKDDVKNSFKVLKDHFDAIPADDSDFDIEVESVEDK